MSGIPVFGARTSVRLALITAVLMLNHGCADDPVTPTLNLPDPPPDPVVTWLAANTHPFTRPHLSLPHTEIEFLRDVVGDARIVALGENTHGARDFFEMKARILRFLVEEMGFNTFAIEATWTESRRLDHYVRTGEGDPKRLLSGLYFWTWNTESVLEMIEWMREHNEAGGDVGFHGFDMQHPGMALHNVREYVRRVEPEALEAVASRLDCLTRYANGPDGRIPQPGYRDQPDSYRTECSASLDEAREFLLSKRDVYRAATGEDAFEIALQSLRVAVQYHLWATREQSRDESMAENTVWISRRIGPEGRMVLWAHNVHVSTQPELQGWHLRETFGDDMVVVGFSHEGGQFTGVDLEATTFRGYPALDLDVPMPDSFEASLARSASPRFVLDLRNRDTSALGSSWLEGERLFRRIGCCYRPSMPERYWRPVPLTEWWDVLIHFERTRATTVLSDRRPPDTW